MSTHIGSNLLGHLAVVEVVGVLRDPFQSAGELGLPEDFTGLVIVAVALENAPRLGKFRQISIA